MSGAVEPIRGEQSERGTMSNLIVGLAYLLMVFLPVIGASGILARDDGGYDSGERPAFRPASLSKHKWASH